VRHRLPNVEFNLYVGDQPPRNLQNADRLGGPPGRLAGWLAAWPAAAAGMPTGAGGGWSARPSRWRAHDARSQGAELAGPRSALFITRKKNCAVLAPRPRRCPPLPRPGLHLHLHQAGDELVTLSYNKRVDKMYASPDILIPFSGHFRWAAGHGRAAARSAGSTGVRPAWAQCCTRDVGVAEGLGGGSRQA
jgi:hypothetical protein